jgi:hypothetical protein
MFAKADVVVQIHPPMTSQSPSCASSTLISLFTR